MRFTDVYATKVAFSAGHVGKAKPFVARRQAASRSLIANFATRETSFIHGREVSFLRDLGLSEVLWNRTPIFLAAIYKKHSPSRP